MQEPLLGSLASPVPLRPRGTAAGPQSAASQQQHYSESLDYELPVNSVSLAKREREAGVEQRHLYGYSGSTLTKVVATLVSGVAIGLTAATMQLLVDSATRHRNRLLSALLAAPAAAPGLPSQPLAHAFGALLGVGLAAVLLATLVVHYWAPKAAGGGVALVMAMLNGNVIHSLLSWRVYLTKLFGTAASRAAGLALGMEGPMIHLGAAVASIVCHAEHILYRRLNLHRHGRLGKIEREALAAGLVPDGAEDFLFTNADHRELVSAGAAAGLAAAFGAPIGGVLFALEEATSVWSRKLAWRCFLCASVACFSMAQLHPRMTDGMLSFSGLTRLTNLQWLIQGPPLVFASVCGALLGSALNMLKRRARFWRRRHPGVLWRLGEATAVVALTAAALLGLPALFGTCLQLPESWNAEEVVRYTCPDGQYNDLATGLLGSAVWVIRSLISLGSEAEPVNNRLCSLALPCYFSAGSLLVIVAAYFALFFLASNLIVPGGLFMPCILIGSAFGALLALLLLEVAPAELDIQPGVYAVVCATAMVGATFRSSISLVVIVVEGTRGIELLFGVILAVIVSNWVAHHLHPDGLYEAELGGQSGQECVYLRQEPPHALRNQTAASVMASPVVGLDGVVPVSSVLQVLRSTTHNGFPVLAPFKPAAEQGGGRGGVSSARGLPGVWGEVNGELGARQGAGRLQGLVLRSQLLVLLRHGAFCDARGRYLCPLARQAAGAFEEALAFEMRAAAQASASGYRRGGSGSRAGAMLGRLGPATSLCLAGVGFPTLDASRGASSVRESAVLDAALEAAAERAGGGRGEPHLNLLPFMSLAPHTVRPKTPAATVHHLFLSMSLRHLCVVDSRCRCVGMITRKDLDHAAGSGWWRATDIAPTPHQSSSGQEGASPSAGSVAGSARSADSRFARALAVPARRLVEALQQRFSPQLTTLTGSAGTAAAGTSSQPQQGQQPHLLRSSTEAQQGQHAEAAALAATAESGAAEPLLLGLGSSAGIANGPSGPALHHSLSAPTNMTRHLQQAAWEDEQIEEGPGAAGAGASQRQDSTDLERQ
ncbi:hypothetical protein ABPG75_007639 [Micractinium tetrahymenae]